MKPVDLGTFDARRGDRFDLPIYGELTADDGLVNLSEYGTGWAAQLRPRATSATFVPFLIDVSNVDGAVDPDRDAPQIVLTLTGVQTQAMDADSYVFDIEVTGGPVSPITLYEGTLRMTPDVTRSG